MTTQEVANRFYELSQEGKWQEIQNELYADNCVSIEPEGTPNWKVEGMEAIREKGKQFNEMTEEVHSAYCNEPIVAGNHFSCAMGMDITMKGLGRSEMHEICVYEVQNGKVVKEQFFFNPQMP